MYKYEDLPKTIKVDRRALAVLLKTYDPAGVLSYELGIEYGINDDGFVDVLLERGEEPGLPF